MEIDITATAVLIAAGDGSSVAHLQDADLTLDSPFLSPQWPRAVERAQEGVDRGLRVAVLHSGGRVRGFMAVRAETVAMAPGAPMCDLRSLVAEPETVLDRRQAGPGARVRPHGLQPHAGEEQTAFTLRPRPRPSWVIDVTDGYAAYVAERRSGRVRGAEGPWTRRPPARARSGRSRSRPTRRYGRISTRCCSGSANSCAPTARPTSSRPAGPCA